MTFKSILEAQVERDARLTIERQEGIDLGHGIVEWGLKDGDFYNYTVLFKEFSFSYTSWTAVGIITSLGFITTICWRNEDKGHAWTKKNEGEQNEN